MVPIIDQREDTAAYRDPWLAPAANLFPGGAEGPDLGSLLDVEWLTGLVVLERRALQIHAELRRPGRGGVGAGAPPDPVAQALRIGLEAQQARRVGEHRARVRLGESLAAQELEQDLGVAPAHIGVALALRRTVAEVAPPLDHLLG